MVVVTIIEKSKNRAGLLKIVRETPLAGGPFADETVALAAIASHQQAYPLELKRNTWRSYRIEPDLSGRLAEPTTRATRKLKS